MRSSGKWKTCFDRLLYLPELDSSLRLRLPSILTPDIDRAITPSGQVATKVSTGHSSRWCRCSTRWTTAQHSRAVVALRDRGRIPAKRAAVPVLELDRPKSMLCLSSVDESISVLAGNSCTPAGLLVATR